MNIGDYAFLAGIIMILGWSLLFKRKRGEAGELFGYNKKLGVSTVYDAQKQANALKRGAPIKGPRFGDGLWLGSALVLMGLGGFIPPITTSHLSAGLLFEFLGWLFIGLAIAIKIGWRIRGRKPALLFGFGIVCIIWAIVLFDAIQNPDAAHTKWFVFSALSMIVLSFVAYLLRKK